METDGVVEETEKVDRLSNLPESLLFEVLLNLPTKDVIKCSLLSSRYRNLWKKIPGLDLSYGDSGDNDFVDLNTFASFIDSFLGLNSESRLENFKLEYNDEYPDITHLPAWIDTVVSRKVKHLHFLVNWVEGDDVEIPLSVYTCESLVSLKLCHVIFPHPEFVSLPCVKVMDLNMVIFANDSGFEMLISSCPVLESLTLCRSDHDNLKVVRVCSQSLLSFILDDGCVSDTEGVIAIDAPRLKYLDLFDDSTSRFMISNMASLVKADLDITLKLSANSGNPNDVPKKMIGNFFVGISSVKHMVITSSILEVMFNYSRCEGVRLPLFRNLLSLDVDVEEYKWEILSVLLETCPNLKSLVLKLFRLFGEEGVSSSVLVGPRRLLTSLEYVKIRAPITDEATEMKLVSYFLANSTILKRFGLCLGGLRKNEESLVLEKFLTIPRLSPSCQIVFL